MLTSGLWQRKMGSFCNYGVSQCKMINALYQHPKANLEDPRLLKQFTTHTQKQILIMINTNEIKLRKGAHNKAHID